MNVDLMDLHECGSPGKLVASILRSNPEIPIPVPIEDLARAVGIVEIRREITDGFEGALVANAEKSMGAIVCNKSSSLPRQRFTVGHELGHFLIPTHPAKIQCSYEDMSAPRTSSASARREAAANKFAAEMLMPEHYFKAELRRQGEPELVHIMALSQRFGTSLEATASRYVHLSEFNCAVVFSHEGTVRYFRRPLGFPRLDVTSGCPLPRYSASARPPESQDREPEDWVEHRGEVWLEDPSEGTAPRVLEQRLAQRDGYQTTLLYIEDPEEEDSEDEDLVESWAPRFKR